MYFNPLFAKTRWHSATYLLTLGVGVARGMRQMSLFERERGWRGGGKEEKGVGELVFAELLSFQGPCPL